MNTIAELPLQNLTPEYRRMSLVSLFCAVSHYRDIMIADGAPTDEADEQTSHALAFLAQTWACVEHLQAMLKDTPEAEADKH
jgi:hypothetical protein